jgi:type III pantothenate kinase
MKEATHLLVDISNSWTKIAPSTLEKVGRQHRHLTHQVDKEYLQQWNELYPNARWIVASVVPKCAELFQRYLPAHRVHFISYRSPLGIGIDYPQPHKIGADRLANAVAVAHFYPCPAVVADFGTALTFDVISAKSEYLGGVIAPGISAMTDYLHERTAQLPKLELHEPKHAIGKSTLEAMQAGTVIGYRGLVREILLQVKKELKVKRVSVVATGGYAELIARKMPEIQSVRPLLTLEGLRIIARHEQN